MSYRILLNGVSLCALALAPRAYGADAAPSYVTAAIQSFERPPLEFQRDNVLKPAEIVALSGAKPGMAVVDLLPGSGYYTRILSGVVGSKGRVYAFVPREGGHDGPLVKDFGVGQPRTRMQRAFAAANQPNLGNIHVYGESIDGQQYPTDVRFGKFALPEQLDVALTAYGYHVLHSAEFAKVDMIDFNKVLYRAMKNNGVVVIVDNAAAKGADPTASTAIGRIDPELVKAEMTAAGFVLDGESKVLAQADDDHSAMADDVLLTRATQAADGFALRFRKPANAPNTDQRPKDYAKAIGGLFGNTTVSGFAPEQRLHFMHADGTYQEISKTSFDSGRWFFNADGWNCRYRPGSGTADCHNYPHEYEHKAGDRWNNGPQREAWHATEPGAKQVMVPGDDYFVLKGYVYDLALVP